MNLQYFITGTDGTKADTLHDVSAVTIGETDLLVSFNKGDSKKIEIRSNDGVGTKDWKIIRLELDRIGLKMGLGVSNE